MNDIFKRRGEQTYNLRKHSQFYRPKVNSVYNGTESVIFRTINMGFGTK